MTRHLPDAKPLLMGAAGEAALRASHGLRNSAGSGGDRGSGDGRPSPAEMEREIAELSAWIDAGMQRQLTLIRWFDESREWARQGAKSCAHWLGWRIGVDVGAARERVRVARALAELPAVDDALRRGMLSFSKVRAVTRVATPGNEALLVDHARRTTAAQLERICRTMRKIERRDAKGPGRPPNLERFVRCRQGAGGMVRIEMQLEADEAMTVWEAILKAGLAGARDELPREEERDRREDEEKSSAGRQPEDEAVAAEGASAPTNSTPQSPGGDRDVSAD